MLELIRREYMHLPKREFGRFLKRKRLEKGFLTQQSLANAMGLGQPQIGKWESGVNLPGPEYMEKLADLLKFDPEKVFSVPHISTNESEISDPEMRKRLLQLEAMVRSILDDHPAKDKIMVEIKGNQFIPRDILLYLERNSPSEGQWANVRTALGMPKFKKKSQIR